MHFYFFITAAYASCCSCISFHIVSRGVFFYHVFGFIIAKEISKIIKKNKLFILDADEVRLFVPCLVININST